MLLGDCFESYEEETSIHPDRKLMTNQRSHSIQIYVGEPLSCLEFSIKDLTSQILQ